MSIYTSATERSNSTASRSSSAVKLPSLTGLRWLAAFLVFGFHVGTLNLIQKPYFHYKWDKLFGQGASGVSFFFVLSGFVLVWSSRPGDKAVSFWRRRVAKIFPNHMVTWGIALAFMFYWGVRVHPEVAVGNLFLIHPWLNFDGFPYSMNTVSWSLGCEAFFYLCFPIVLPLIKRVPAWTLYALVAVCFWAIQQAGVTASHMQYPWNAWFSYLFPPVRSLEFWIGVAVGELVVRRRWGGPGLWGGTAVAALLYGSTRGVSWWPVSTPAEWWSADLAVAYVILIAGAAQADIAGAWSPWRNKVMVKLGEISFAFYLVHVMFIENILAWLHRNGVGWSVGEASIVIPVLLSCAMALAWLLYTFVELPMMRILGPSRRRPPPTGAETAIPEPRTDSAEPPTTQTALGALSNNDPRDRTPA